MELVQITCRPITESHLDMWLYISTKYKEWQHGKTWLPVSCCASSLACFDNKTAQLNLSVHSGLQPLTIRALLLTLKEANERKVERVRERGRGIALFSTRVK